MTDYQDPPADHPLEDALRAAEGWAPFVLPYEMPTVPLTTRERTQLLLDANAAIGGDRERGHGDAIAGFERIAAMWSAILGTTVTAEQYGMCMVAVKLGRLAETPNHRDSWMDVAGYAALTAEIAAEIAATEGRYL